MSEPMSEEELSRLERTVRYIAPSRVDVETLIAEVRRLRAVCADAHARTERLSDYARLALAEAEARGHEAGRLAESARIVSALHDRRFGDLTEIEDGYASASADCEAWLRERSADALADGVMYGEHIGAARKKAVE